MDGINSEEVRYLPQRLKELQLIATDIDDACLEALPPTLEKFLFRGIRNYANSALRSQGYPSDITPAGLSKLPQKVSSLSLMEYGVTDELLAALPRNLIEFGMNHFPNTTIEGFMALPPGLKSLNLGFSKVTSEILQSLPEKLQALNLSFTKIRSRDLIELLGRLVELEKLNIRNCEHINKETIDYIRNTYPFLTLL